MTLKERIKSLADAEGISLPVLESRLGFGNSTIVKWDKSTPNAEKLNKVAQYFNVTMDYLLNGESITDNSDLNTKDKKDIAKDLESIMDKLNSKEAGPASFDGNDIPEDDRELFATQLEAMLIRLKKINKDLYNPNKNKK
ncbi:helix-turn-helix domain-containing protein [Blautia sp.]|uniref:helix-turn-helix domain-containing protein n=1 Tax=Blautia sp. TaxID=1955243 RepID=UPI003AF8FF0D